MSLEKELSHAVSAAFTDIWGVSLPSDAIGIQPTKKEFEGTHTLVCFPLARFSKLSPEATADTIGKYLTEKISYIAHYNVVKGFLNLSITDLFWLENLKKIAQTPQYGFGPKKDELVVVEYSSPNTNKPLHLGHLRNNFLGYSVAEILEANGYHVVRNNLVNDRGIHICKSMLAYQKLGNGVTPESSGVKGDHLVGKYYVEFDKMLKAEMKPISKQVEEGDLALFNEVQQKTIQDAKAKIAAVQEVLKRENETIAASIEGKTGGVYERMQEAATGGISWKNLQKQLESLLKEQEDDQLLKSIQKAIKSAVSAEAKLDEQKETIDELIKTKTQCLQEAQEMLKKWEEGDPETVNLWKTMNAWVYAGFDDTYQKIGVKFDKFYYESDTYLLGKDVVEEGLAKGVFFKKDNGSVWIDLKEEGLDEKLVLRGDGTSVYITQDMGTADLKFKDFPFTKSIYVVGNEQDYHFKVLQAILKRMGRHYADGIYHLSYGMVDLPSGKMKSREGTVVDADDLVDEVTEKAEDETRNKGKIDDFSPEEASTLFKTLGLGALKYYLLKVDPQRRMLFNPEESVALQGNTGPFIQYTHARIRSILRKADDMGIHFPWEFDRAQLLPEEKDLVVCLSKFPQVVKEAGDNYSPAEIANYAYELAKEYNSFYQVHSIFKEPEMPVLKSRLLMSYVTCTTIRTAMKLLGIEVPERM